MKRVEYLLDSETSSSERYILYLLLKKIRQTYYEEEKVFLKRKKHLIRVERYRAIQQFWKRAGKLHKRWSDMNRINIYKPIYKGCRHTLQWVLTIKLKEFQ